MKSEIKKIIQKEQSFPNLLLNIKNPPKELYLIGDISICDEPCIAIVGSRKSTSYGKWVSYMLGKKLAEHGVVVVSGMAAGIDAESHKGALAGGGKTIAVLGCGPDICYPKSNKALYESIKTQGLILSEYPIGTKPLPWMFPARNRIISGLSFGVIIIEADRQSGSLITANFALDQGKEVFAVPGNIDSIYSRGTNKLIQDGATPIIDLDDIIEHLGLEVINKTRSQNSYINLGEDEKKIIRLIEKHGRISHDALTKFSGKQPGEVGALLTILELKGEIQVLMGKIQVAKKIL